MKAQQENLILFFMLISQERDVQRTFLENSKMSLFNYVGDQTIHRQPGPPGPPGPQGPSGLSFNKTSDGNYDAANKKLTNLQKCVDEKDAANKKYVDGILKGVGNLAFTGKYVGSLKTIGSSVNLGLDSSKGQLFNFGMKIGTDTSTALGSTKFSITMLCGQNVNIVLTLFYDVNTCRVNLKGSTMTLVSGNDLMPVNIVEVDCFAIMGYLTELDHKDLLDLQAEEFFWMMMGILFFQEKE